MTTETKRLLTRAEVKNAKELFSGREITISALALKEAYGMLEFHDSLGCENDTCALCLFLFKIRPELIDPNETRSRLVAKAKANPITIIREYEGGSDVG